jgi:hypothetical protein
MPSAIQARACLRDLSHAAMHIIIIPPRRDPEARRNLSRREQCANCRPTAGFSPLGVNLLTEPSRNGAGPARHAGGLRAGKETAGPLQPADLDAINDCNQYRILIRFPDNAWLKVGKTPYFLSELHFRQPGENAIHGKRPSMSVQLVHLSPESRFLIIEVAVVAGKENPAMKTLLEHVPERGRKTRLPE